MSESKLKQAVMSRTAYEEMCKEYEGQDEAGRGFKGKVNLYTCKKCGSVAISRDLDAGVTPFGFICQELDCNGHATSSCYKVLEPKDCKMKEHLQWYRPSYLEYSALPPDAVEHVNRGGLLPRKAIFEAKADPAQPNLNGI